MFLLAHIAVWTALPVLFHPNAPLDVVEEVSWGRQWQLGYYKHPPLSAWLANIAYICAGGHLWGIFLLSQVAIAISWLAAWRVARVVVGDVRAFACVALLEGVIYYNLTSPEFNPNVLELALWPLIVWLAWRVLPRADRPGGTSVHPRSPWDWILLGFFAGLGLLAKYYTALLLLSLLSFFAIDRRAREVFKTAGPYIAAAVALVVFSPHLAWMANNGFVTIRYALQRTEAQKSPLTHFAYPASFASGQLVAVAGMLIGFAALFGFARRSSERGDDSQRRFLAAVVWGPFLLTLIVAVALNWRLHSMWGTPLWTFLPLLLAERKQPPLDLTRRKTAAVGAVLMALYGLVFVASLVAEPYLYKQPRKALFPGREMAAQVTQTWHERTGEPLRYVVGNTWLVGNVAFYSSDRPSTFVDADLPLSPWVSLARLRESGAVIVWDEPKMPAAYAAMFPQAEEQPALRLRWHTRAPVPDVVIHYAIVPPAPH